MRILIAAGGTGGHINPALSAAQELRRRYPDAAILPVSARTGEGIDAVCDWVREVVRVNGKH